MKRKQQIIFLHLIVKQVKAIMDRKSPEGGVVVTF